ncbi:zinc-finger associated domain containing protein, partial [Oryctes borbonicus]
NRVHHRHKELHPKYKILEEDRVSTMVCHKCCSLAIKLYQYRQTALANDKALKEIANEPFKEPPSNKDAILELHKSILDNISQCKVSESVAQVYRVPLDDVSHVNNEDKVTKDDVIVSETTTDSEPHETVKKIFQYFPTAVVPREILDSNVLPSVPVDRDIKKYIRSEYEVTPADNSDGRVLKFKRKYPSTDVVKLSVKRRRNEEDSNSMCFSDSDSSIPSVFKSRKKDSNTGSDGSCSDCDSDAPDGDEKLSAPSPVPPVPTPPPPTPATESRTNSRPSRSKASKNPLQFPDSDSDSEVTKKPANTHYCEICDRTFWGWSQLKSHQRTHLKCIICRIICDSQEDLEYHQKTVCFKWIEYNQPILVLPKVDENPFLLRIYKDAFDRYYQDIDDGVYGSTEPPPPPDPDYP